VSKMRMPQMPLPFSPLDLSDRLSNAARQRAVALLQQMLIGATRADLLNKDRDDEREDPADPS
jgi:hypothetical protein